MDDGLNELFTEIKGIIVDINNFEWKTRKDKRQAHIFVKKLEELTEKYKNCKIEEVE